VPVVTLHAQRQRYLSNFGRKCKGYLHLFQLCKAIARKRQRKENPLPIRYRHLIDLIRLPWENSELFFSCRAIPGSLDTNFSQLTALSRTSERMLLTAIVLGGMTLP